MSFSQIIGLVGASGAGKATVAAHLCDRHDFRSYALADPLRQVLYGLDPLLSSTTSLRPVVDEFGWAAAMSNRIHGPEVTRLLNALRCDVAREVFGADVWLRRLEAVIATDTDMAGPAPVVLTDVSTLEEAQWVLDGGGVIWRVDRPGTPAPTHLPDRFITTEIRNNDTVLALTRRVDRAMAGLIRHDDATVA